MGRTIYAEEKLLTDLTQLTKLGGYVPGLIIGQSSGTKDFIIHLARTPLTSPSNPELHDDHKDTKTLSVPKLADINEPVVADHAKEVTRMLPGGMWVLGVFIVGPGDLFADPSCQSKLISLLSTTDKILSKKQHLYGNSPAAEKLVFFLNTESKKYSCRSVDIRLNSAVPLKPADWKFQNGCTKWHQIDCHYDCEQIVPHILTKENVTYPLKRHLQEILSHVNTHVNKAICTIDGEIKDSSDSLEVTDKKKKGKQAATKSSTKVERTLEANLYTICDLGASDKDMEVIQIFGEMRCNGTLSSRVFLHQKASVEEAVKAVKEDIIRSFSSRLEMHWDSLVEEELASPEDRVVLHEPPRRVLLPLPHSKVALCDYLFPGEGISESLLALQDLLGLKVTEASVLKDFEGQIDIEQLYELTNSAETITEERSQTGVVLSTSHILIGGVVIAVLVIITSVVVQYLITSKSALK